MVNIVDHAENVVEIAGGAPAQNVVGIVGGSPARERKPADMPKVAPRKARSRVTNGKSLFVEFDGRGPWTRRFRDVLGQIVSDLGGADLLSEGQRQLARRCATISIACERMEGEAAAGHDIDLDQYGTLTDRLGRCFQRLGLKRQARDVGPSLGDLLRRDHALTTTGAGDA
jgi:hypothetical protein